jgi:signal transduction histidine kinase
LVTQAVRGAGPALRAAQFDAVHVEQLREIQGRIMEAEQQGRRVVARDLHDGVQQHLLALSMELRRMERIPEGPDRQAQLSDCVARAEGISEEVRRISRGVYPQLLAESGLASALEEDAEHLGRRVLLHVPETRLPARIELALYYVISEAITNADKHSGASTISVTVTPGPFSVRAVIRDDGVGGASIHIGGGLHGIDDRVRAMGGRMNLSDARGGGTLLTVVLPAEGTDDASSDR